MVDSENIAGLEARISPRKTSWIVGGLTALALAAGGIAAMLLPGNNAPVPDKLAVVTPTVPVKKKSERYQTIAEKYAEQVESGRKYVAEKIGVPLEQVETVVVDEILPGYGPRKPGGVVIPQRGGVKYLGKDLLPTDETALFAAYVHPKGDSILIVEESGKIHERYGAVFCNDNMRKAAYIIREHMANRLSDGSEIAFRDIHPNRSGDPRIYNAYVIDGWDNPHRRPSQFERYVINIENGQFQRFSGVYVFGSHECE